jgi:hypothetical protein
MKSPSFTWNSCTYNDNTTSVHTISGTEITDNEFSRLTVINSQQPDGSSIVESLNQNFGVCLREYKKDNSSISLKLDTFNTDKITGHRGLIGITLIDNKTGQYINNATVSAGTITSSGTTSSGNYTIVVPLTLDDILNNATTVDLAISLEGYHSINQQIELPPDQWVYQTHKLEPILGTIEGKISLAKFSALYSVSDISISVDGLQGVQHPDDNGDFTFEVPVRSNNNNRKYTMRVTGKGTNDLIINNIIAPIAGAVKVKVPPLTPITVTVLGTVINPNVAMPAIISNIGLESGISGGAPQCPSGTRGAFAIDGVPTNTSLKLNIQATVYTFNKENCAAGFNYRTASLEEGFIAVNNGEGVYRVGTISASGS